MRRLAAGMGVRALGCAHTHEGKCSCRQKEWRESHARAHNGVPTHTHTHTHTHGNAQSALTWSWRMVSCMYVSYVSNFQGVAKVLLECIIW